MKKKFLALLMASALCVGMLPSTVLADVEQPEEDSQVTSEIGTDVEEGDEAETSGEETLGAYAEGENEVETLIEEGSEAYVEEGSEAYVEDEADALIEEGSEAYVEDEADALIEEESEAYVEYADISEYALYDAEAGLGLSYDEACAEMQEIYTQALYLEDADSAEALWDNLMDIWEQIYAGQEEGALEYTEDEMAALNALTDAIYACVLLAGFDPYAIKTLDEYSIEVTGTVTLDGGNGTWTQSSDDGGEVLISGNTVTGWVPGTVTLTSGGTTRDHTYRNGQKYHSCPRICIQRRCF